MPFGVHLLRSQLFYWAAQATRGYLLGKGELHAGLPGQQGQACFFFSLSLTLLCLLPFPMLGLCKRNHIDNVHRDHTNSDKSTNNNDDESDSMMMMLMLIVTAAMIIDKL